ncbi:MAG: hypothetical protein Q8K21_12975 [Hydrogenophaga sp.]|uniref:hypothetical protein n=1 Tax=Hydrogenophaga sp. TaxID=1904254 RepID=UPI00272F9E75|nr:hypothetical protein [Hydrogenophaga sp.]MDP2165105.1 hypothetical protein [Hydrogenophaga sp.]MDP3476845.1 hypothetical protein [Hydrogenophaga sp.]
MTDNKKGLAAANDQAPNLHAKHKTNFIRRAALYLMTAVVEITAFGILPICALLIVDRLWGG